MACNLCNILSIINKMKSVLYSPTYIFSRLNKDAHTRFMSNEGIMEMNTTSRSNDHRGKPQVFKHVTEIVRFYRSICLRLSLIKKMAKLLVKSLSNCNRNC